jgi:hypothetical protein
MRLAPILVVAACLVSAACKKTASNVITTDPLTTDDSILVSGTWNGCLIEPREPCLPITMTLADTSVTDSTETVGGTGNWGANVTIKGKLGDTKLTLNAATEGVLQGWSFSGFISGNAISGNMTVPGNDTLYQANFTRSP